MATRMNQNILWGYSKSQHSVILHKNPPRLFYSLSGAEKGTVPKKQKGPSAYAVDETRRSLLTLFKTYLRWDRNAIGQLRVPTVNQLPPRHAESPPLHLADARMGTRRRDHLHRTASHCWRVRQIRRACPRAARSADPGAIAPSGPASPRAQAKSSDPGRDKTTRRANHQNLSSPVAKNIPLNPSGKSLI
jgi:hypothetical protein